MSALATGDSGNDSSNNPNTAVNAIVNGSFEDPPQKDRNAPQLEAGDVSGWSTTAIGQLIEFGVNIGKSSAPQLSGNDKRIPDGNQFAELNADEVSTLYQNVSTVGGHIYEWGLSHRGREGKDTMALIIGPKQANAPAKPNENGQDQFMRLTDWVQRNAQTLGVTVPRDGCSQRITVYSKKFDENGGFLNNPGSESPFSTAPSNLYTETWSVWIIATGNQSWGSYGTHDPTYDPLKGIGGGIGCSYTVPVGQNETTFAFCSYAGATSDKTLGNLLDNITFSLYHNVTFTTTAGGQGTVSAEIQGTTQTVDFSDKNAIDVPVRHNREMTLTAPATADSGATFVGAYITRHSTSGSSTEFVDKSNESKWKLNGTTYTYTGTVTAPTDVVLVFVRSPAVTYDANGGDKYVHTPDAQEPTDVVSFAAGTGPYTSHAATASQKTGWVFDGWLLARAGNGLVLPEEHTVSYANGVFTFAYSDGTGPKKTEITANGVALLAQWRWQQTFQTQLQKGDTVTDTDACGTITTKDGQTANTYNAATGEQVTVTANANEGYAFLGWYRTIDGQLQLVSQEKTYAYTVGKQGVQTVYARFARTYTITYTWDTSDNKPTDQTVPDPGTATEGTTYPLSQAFVPQQTTVSDTVNDVPGHWLFQGWKEKDGTDYLGQEIANVTRNYDLVGSWSFIPNNRYRLTYNVGDHTTNWIPSGLGAVVQSNPLHYYQEKVTSAAAPTIPAAENTILAANGTTFQGTWTFQGWKRSDTGETVSAENSAEKNFSMPNQDLTLTAQWKFTPNVYTVQYDLNGGTGVPPAGHDSYTYPEIKGKTGVDTSKSGIPFGASVQLRDFLGTPPTGKYFAGWGLTPNGPVAYEPEESVNNESLKVTTSRNTITLYAIYKNIGTVTVEFAENDANRGSVDVRQGSFSERNGTLSGDTAQGDTVKSVATAKPGYHFTSWKCETSGYTTKTETLTVTLDQVQTLFKEHPNQRVFRFTAQFEPNCFTVQYNANGGKGTMDDQTFQYAEAGNAYLKQNAFVRPGYRFLGWSETADGTGTSYADQAKFQGVTHYQGNEITDGATITLYAQWKELPEITIDYTPFPEDLGTVTLNTAQTEEPSEEDLVPQSIYTVSETGSPDHQVHTFQGATAKPKDGCTFKGWYDQQENQCSKDLSFVPQAGTDNLYQSGSYVAVFEAQQYTLHFDANGGEGTMGDLTYTHGQDQSLTKCGFTRAGYDFLGWATAADGNVVYHDQQSLSITQDTTLYAVWKQQPNQGGSGGGHHNSGSGTQEKPDETPPTTLNDTDHYAYIVGYEDGTIRPNGHITRAEAATVFFRLLTDEARDANLTDRSPYPDVSAGDWYNKAIATLSRMGILSGYEDGSFRPNATVTRAEFAAMAARFDTEAKPVDTPFTDLTGCWAADEIAKAYGKGWVNGYGDNTFRPNGPITRAEAVTLINRVLRRLPETDKDLLPDERTWPDNPETFWGYLALQEASNSHLYDRKSDGYETQTKILPPRDWSQEFEQ
ncbi:MAG: S-layer homology domain-containing protein [Evtepia sp.]|nr:S-layer homology domain-containing protein [Evtepia sp.]